MTWVVKKSDTKFVIRNLNQQGFNKVEIVIIATIIISMLLIFLNSVLDIQRSIRDTKRRGDIETIARELEVHFNHQPGQFCQSAPVDSYCQIKSDWFTNNQIPVDPATKELYLNLPKDGDKTFLICAKLEKENNSLKNLPTYNSEIKAGYHYCSSNRQ